MTRVLLVGSGAREDAIAHSLIKRPDVELCAAMSSPNPGITANCERHQGNANHRCTSSGKLRCQGGS